MVPLAIDFYVNQDPEWYAFFEEFAFFELAHFPENGKETERFGGNLVCELRLDFGPGYRIYYMRNGPVVIVLLAGGDKSSQEKDIETALRVAHDWRNQ